MDDLDIRADVPRGGHARGGSGFFHLSFRSGSRGGGACAKSAYEYITRTEQYDDPDRDEATYTESDHMPSWAHEAPDEYWDAADVYERANGRLYVSADFALPRELDSDEQMALAREFAHELTDDERLPYTLAVHAGHDDAGHEHNPHAHLMFSERRNDGIERSRDEWFRRANSEHPEHGGAPKSRTFHGSDWIEYARERWATLTNETLERCGRSERVDHRSYERQGIDREPGEHYGPSAAHVIGRGGDHDRLESAAGRVDDERALREIDDQIAKLQAARDTIARDGLPDEEQKPERRDYSHSSRGDRGDDQSPER
jgi:MobA/MobL family